MTDKLKEPEGVNPVCSRPLVSTAQVCSRSSMLVLCVHGPLCPRTEVFDVYLARCVQGPKCSMYTWPAVPTDRSVRCIPGPLCPRTEVFDVYLARCVHGPKCSMYTWPAVSTDRSVRCIPGPLCPWTEVFDVYMVRCIHSSIYPRSEMSTTRYAHCSMYTPPVVFTV